LKLNAREKFEILIPLTTPLDQPNKFMNLKILSLPTSLFAVLLFYLSCPLRAQEDSLDRDYAPELPRIRPLEPQDALASFDVISGYRLEQVAAEPLVTDPVAMAFDGDGRLYIVEMRDYSEHPEENLGRIRVLIDTNGDGIFDRGEIFADQLSWPVAITCFHGGVFVGAPPHLIYLKDHDGDFKADESRVALTGFGRGNVQGLMNSLHWGLDHRIHGATSSSGASLTRPDVPNQAPLVLRGRDFAFDPKTMDVAATSGGGQHGMDFNRWGEKFICSNSNHLQYVHFEDGYLSNNPYLAAPGPSRSIASDGPQADVFRASPIEPWRIVRTRLRKQGIVPGPVEGGGTPAGYFTGATGVTLFEGTAWPETDKPWAVIGDVGSNLIHRKQLQRQGTSYLGQRVDTDTELVRSRDIWFRPVQFSNAPDGALYIVDMYREVIEHPASLPPLIKKHLDLDSGRNRGRIYRLVSESFRQPPLPRLESATTLTLVETLNHANDWQRTTANRLLWERQDPATPELVKRQLAKPTSAEGWIQCLSVLAGQDALDEETVLRALTHDHPMVRKWALRWSEEFEQPSVDLLRKILLLADDPDVNVRTQLAFTLGSRQGASIEEALSKIALRDYQDPIVRVAVTSALGQSAIPVLSTLLHSDEIRSTPEARTWMANLGQQILRQQNEGDLVSLLGWFRDFGSTDDRHADLVQIFSVEVAHPWHDDLQAALGDDAAQKMAQTIAQAKRDAGNSSLNIADRLTAIERLRLGSFDDVGPLLATWLDPASPPEIQRQSLGALLSFSKETEVASLLIDRWPTLSPAARQKAVDGLLTRPAWTQQILVAMEQAKLKASDFQTAQIRWLLQHPDSKIRELAQRVVATESDRTKVVDKYRNTLENLAIAEPATLERGERIFTEKCANCHQLGSIGHPVGPSIAGMRNRGAEAILVNVLDPNREINPQYISYILETVDGRQVAGMIAAETANSITLQQGEDKQEVILRADLVELTSSGVSLMPEGLEREISPAAMSDLIAYLMSGDWEKK
jgi:putative membrane-bound dehydrogenase-like protein